MPKWKRRDPRNKFKGFLEHLDSNYYDEKQRKISHLKKTFYPYAEKLIKQLDKEGIIKKKKDIIEITLKGEEYLNNLLDQKFKDRLLEMEKEKVMVEIFAILSATLVILSAISNNNLLKVGISVSALIAFVISIILLVRYFDLRKFIKR